MPYHSIRDDPSVDIEMVELLLQYDADPNQQVHLNEGRSVWALFLLSMHESHRQDSHRGTSTYKTLEKAWYKACSALIQAGAKSDCLSISGNEKVNALFILRHVFGPDRAVVLEEEMRQKSQGQSQSRNPCVIM
jgi:hypothetical protein